jgi:hypothetical protein
MACAMYISDTSNDRFWAKEVPFGGLIDEKHFSRGNIPSPKLSKGILHGLSDIFGNNKSANNVETVQDRR